MTTITYVCEYDASTDVETPMSYTTFSDRQSDKVFRRVCTVAKIAYYFRPVAHSVHIYQRDTR
jgi:hypothetical protein